MRLFRNNIPMRKNCTLNIKQKKIVLTARNKFISANRRSDIKRRWRNMKSGFGVILANKFCEIEVA